MQSAATRHQPRQVSIIWVIVGVIVVAVVVFMVLDNLINGNLRRAVAVGDRFVQAAQAGDAGAAYNLGSDSFKRATQQQAVASVFERTERYMAGGQVDLAAKRLVKDKRQDTKAVMVYTVKKGKDTAYVRVILDDPNGSWQLHNFRIDINQPLQATLD